MYYNDLLSFKLSQDCGCDDEEALNFNNEVLINDNSCCYIAGCTDQNSINYDDLACYDDNSCIPIVLGCNLPCATNTDSLANTSLSFAGPDYVNLGPGGYHYNDMWDMVFNCSQTVNIKSIDIYAETSFSTQIEILDDNDIQIFSTNVDFVVGLNQVDLNFQIPEGNNYKIGINGNNGGLYRNSSVTNNTFPINLLDVIEITSNTTDSPEDYYYYFYNWQLEIACDIILGCTDEFACNYNEFACEEDNSCVYPEIFYDCQGDCLSDIDNDFICDELDNCPEEYNPNQEDFNFDNEGDACDNIVLDEYLISKQSIQVFDLLGRSVNFIKDRSTYIFICEDGTVEKKYFK